MKTKQRITIGRENCTIRLAERPNPRTSREHATLCEDESGALWIIDHSTNGTYVHDERIVRDRPYAIRWGEPIVFAREEPLDWGAVSRFVPRPKEITPVPERGTMLYSVARSFMKSMLEWEDRSTHFGLIFQMIPSPSGRLIRYYNDDKPGQLRPVNFLLTILTLWFFFQDYLLKSAGAVQESVMPDFVRDIFRTVSLGLLFLVVGFLQYKLFKVASSRRVSPRRYFDCYITLTAFSTLVILFCFLPVIPPVRSSIGDEVAGVVAGLSFIFFVFWLFYHNLNLNRKIWQISFGRAFLCYMAVGIVSFVITFAYSWVFSFALE